MPFEYLHLQLIRCGAKNIVHTEEKLYFNFNEKHWRLENKKDQPGKGQDSEIQACLEQYDPQYNLPSLVQQTFKLKSGDWRAVIAVLKEQPTPEEKPAHQPKPKIK